MGQAIALAPVASHYPHLWTPPFLAGPKGKGENVRFVGNGKPLWGEPFDRLRATSNVEWGGHERSECRVRGSLFATAFRARSSGTGSLDVTITPAYAAEVCGPNDNRQNINARAQDILSNCQNRAMECQILEFTKRAPEAGDMTL